MAEKVKSANAASAPMRTRDRSSRSVDWEELWAKARQHFGIRKLRPGQRELIETVLAGHDALGVLPTGAGKSLCYELPALVLPGLVVVVSPLIALMRDQLEHMAEADLQAARLDSTVPAGQQRLDERAIRQGARNVVLVTPERLTNPAHLEALKRSGVSLFVVDEAHCVSHWGHDFRPAYLELREAIAALGRPPVLAVTATAPPDRTRDILRSLGIPDARVVRTGIERDNLLLEVRATVNRSEKERELLSLLRSEEGQAIVYVATVRRTDELCAWLAGEGLTVTRYHGRLRPAEREQAYVRFMEGKDRMILATNAFGLGVDKPDVRAVIHWNFPASLESYYQEAGRAGRDGRPARCTLLYRLEDKRVWSFLLGGRYPRAVEVRRFLDALDKAPSGESVAHLAAACDLSRRRASALVASLLSMGALDRIGTRVRLRGRLAGDARESFLASYDELAGADRQRLATMMRYAETAMCRMQFLREYFGESAGEPCGHCDNCARPRRRLMSTASREHRVRRRRAPATGFSAGDRVEHPLFGSGEVIEARGEELRVAFAHGEERRMLGSFLERRSDGAERRHSERVVPSRAGGPSVRRQP